MANVRRLIELGMVPPLAKEVAAQIGEPQNSVWQLVEASALQAVNEMIAELEGGAVD